MQIRAAYFSLTNYQTCAKILQHEEQIAMRSTKEIQAEIEKLNKELEEAKQKELKSFFVHMVVKTSDMVEGRGPTVDVVAFASEDDAWAYCCGRHGVMGRVLDWRAEQKRRGWPSDWGVKKIQVFE